MSVLWIDNAPNDLPMVTTLVRARGADIEYCLTIQDALYRLTVKKEEPECILLDAFMPFGRGTLALPPRTVGSDDPLAGAMTGWYVLAAVPKLRRRTIVLSVLAAERLKECGFHADVAGFVCKGNLGMERDALQGLLKRLINGGDK